MIKLELNHAFLEEKLADYQEKVNVYHQQLLDKTGLGNDFVGWVDGRTIMTRMNLLVC